MIPCRVMSAGKAPATMSGSSRMVAHGIALHPIVPGPGLLRCVEVKSRTQAEIVSTIRVIRHALATRGGVRGDQDQPQFGRGALGAGLYGEVLLGACQSGEEPHNRQFPLRTLWRYEGGEAHLRARRFRTVAEDVLRAAEAARCRDNIGGRVRHYVLHLWITPG